MIDDITFALLCYNEGYVIKSLIDDIVNIVKNYDIKNYDIVIVDDGSNDFTKEILDDLKRQYSPHIRVVSHQRNLGYGAAHRSALQSSNRSWVLYTDGDGQYPISNFSIFIKNYEDSIVFYTGIRKDRKGTVRKIVTFFYNKLISFFFGLPFYDFGCAFRLIKRECLHLCVPISNTAFSSAEQIIKAHKNGITIKQLEITHGERIYGRSRTFNMSHILKIIYDMIKLKWKLKGKNLLSI